MDKRFTLTDLADRLHKSDEVLETLVVKVRATDELEKLTRLSGFASPYAGAKSLTADYLNSNLKVGNLDNTRAKLKARVTAYKRDLAGTSKGQGKLIKSLRKKITITENEINYCNLLEVSELKRKFKSNDITVLRSSRMYLPFEQVLIYRLHRLLFSNITVKEWTIWEQ